MSDSKTTKPTFLWINGGQRPQGAGVDLLKVKYGGPNFTLEFRELQNVSAKTVDALVEETGADYVIVDGKVPIYVIALLLEGEYFKPRYEDRILRPARDKDLGQITRIVTYLPVFRTKRFA
jgi:hypothetical protein